MTTPEGLKLLLANTFSLAAATHLAHWNIRGKQFVELHELFGDQYNELYKAADDIAEKMRALKLMAVGGVEVFAKTKTIPDVPQAATADNYITYLLASHEAIIKQGIEFRKFLGKADDLETQNFVIGQVEARQKNAWMLRSLLA